MNNSLGRGCLLFLLLAGLSSAQTGLPSTLPFQGRLVNPVTGLGITGAVKIAFNLYGQATGGASLWTETQVSVPVTKGIFKVEIGSSTAFAAGIFSGQKLYLGIQVGTDGEMIPRLPITSQAYAKVAQSAMTAKEADQAKDVNGRDIHPKSVSIGTTTVIDGTGRWTGPPTGLVGPTGPAGPQGSQGPMGTRGAQGPIGPLGPTGPKGNDGATGATGPIGVTGKTGQQGPTGPVGASPFVMNGKDVYYMAGDVGLGTTKPAYPLDALGTGLYVGRFINTSTSASLRQYGILSEAKSSLGIGLFGNATHSTGSTYGVMGRSNSSQGYGVFGSSNGNIGVYGVATAPSSTLLNNYGVYGTASGGNGTGVLGRFTSSSGGTKGVYGLVSSPYGYGVFGNNTTLMNPSSTVNPKGVYGLVQAPNGIGVCGINSSTSTANSNKIGVKGTAKGEGGIGVLGLAEGTANIGVRGESTSPGGIGCYGLANGSNGSAGGVFQAMGTTLSTYGVRCLAGSSSPSGMAATYNKYGVHALAFGSNAIGVYGYSAGNSTIVSSYLTGVKGSAGTSNGYGVYSKGRFGCTGTKAFLQPHPTDSTKEIQFICLEGNESGTYFRGTGKLVNGACQIDIPEEWKLVTDAQGITVQVSPIKSYARLTVWSKSLTDITVRGTKDCSFDYFVNGRRRGYEEYQAYLENTSYRPKVKGVPYGKQYPEALRNILVKNGILNRDYTPNEATAARNGWQLLDKDEVPQEDRWWEDDTYSHKQPQPSRPAPLQPGPQETRLGEDRK